MVRGKNSTLKMTKLNILNEMYNQASYFLQLCNNFTQFKETGVSEQVRKLSLQHFQELIFDCQLLQSRL